MIRVFTIFIILISIAITSGIVVAQGGARQVDAIVLPPDLMALLNAEMREINTGVQKIPVAIALGDWETLAQTGESIRSSYIMARSLTGEQKKILKSSLPERFKQMDSEFHSRAGKLAHAAEARDYELATYHYARLIEGCAQCHAMYAKDKFPGFGPAEEQGHQH